MKRLWVGLLLAFLIFNGISFLVFVLRMMWFPPSMMGMMMGKQMMIYHMLHWCSLTFWLSIMFVGIIMFIYILRQSKKNKQE